MSVKLVMGAQRDSLEKLEKFGGEDGGVIFPHFRQDLENAHTGEYAASKIT